MGDDIFSEVYFVLLYNCVDLKRMEIIRSAHIVLLILHMSNLFTCTLGVGALLVDSLVSLATVCFIIFEKTSHIKALQETLHSVCLRTVVYQIEDTDSTSEDIVHGLLSTASFCLFTKRSC